MVRFGIRVCFGLSIVAFLCNILLQQQFVLVSASAQPTISVPARKFTAPQGMPDPNIIFQQVNNARITNGLPALERNDTLTQLAEQRAKDMSNNDYYAHKGSDGLFFDALLKQNGYSIDYGCENLDLEFTMEPGTYIHAWLKSNAGHKECLLNSKATQAGYAVTQINTVAGEDFPCYVVVAIHSTLPEPDTQ